MRRSLRRAWLPVVGTGILLLGCAHNPATRYPPDPLLVSKKPIESRAESGLAHAAPRHEPRAPEVLVAALPSPRSAQDAVEGARRPANPAAPASLRREDSGDR
jgi:hypothetical protein